MIYLITPGRVMMESDNCAKTKSFFKNVTFDIKICVWWSQGEGELVAK